MIVDAPLRNVHLYGELADICEPKIRLAVHTPAEAVRAILTNFPKSQGPIREGEFYLIRGETLEEGWNFDEEFLHFGLGKDDLHIIPVASGAIFGGGQRSKGVLKVILGAALIAGAFYFAGPAGLSAVAFEAPLLGAVTYGNIALFGASMIFGGISYLLAPVPDKISSDEGGEQPRSFLYRGPVNNVAQGNPVPVVYGQMRVGSQVISVGIENTTPTGDGIGGAPDELQACLNASNGPVILMWKALQGAQSYQYRFRPRGGVWSEWAGDGTDTSVQISASNFSTGIVYEFQIRANLTEGGSGSTSIYSPHSSTVSLEYGKVGKDSDQNDEDQQDSDTHEPGPAPDPDDVPSYSWGDVFGGDDDVGGDDEGNEGHDTDPGGDF